MENKTQIIHKNLQSIREALYGDENACVTIDQVAEDVARLAAESSAGGLTTAFVFSTDIKSNRPMGGTLDLNTGLVEGVEGWSQTIITSNVDDLLMSFAIFNPEGEIVTDWSIPVNLKGKVSGKDGEQGPAGPQGLPGEKGDTGVSYRTISVYTTTDSVDNVPSRPKGGSWDMKTNTLSLPTTDDGTRWWTNIDDEPDPKKFVWTSNATFQDNGNLVGDWSVPFRITGEDGKNGSDGRVIEFIYRLLPNYNTYLILKDFLNRSENKLPSPNEADYIPSVNDNLDIGSNWEDRPVGINSTMQVEVACSRVKNSIDEPWGEWSSCAIWSKWGEDGMDGDSVEYIYLVTPAEINGIPTTSGHVKDIMVPTYSLEGNYQNDEFCFNDTWGFEGYDWTDEPRDVGPGKPMEWVMVRKQKDGVWQSFSDPALWATYSMGGVTYITSFVFTRATVNDSPEQPKGGDYDHPYPTIDGSDVGQRDDNWHDSVPSDGTLPVWMSTRTFCNDYRYDDDSWSEPKMLSDNPDFQVEYSAYPNEISREKISKFEGDSTEENEERWRAYQLSEYKIEWGDDTKIKNPVWMITATRHGGIWSDWTISKIKGEKGDKGEPGSSVRIEGQFETLEQLKGAWSEYVNTGNLDKFHFESKDGTINTGDGWYVIEDGKLYSYSGGWHENEDDSRFETYWFGTPIKGKPGDSFYIYIAYCNELNANAIVDLIGPGKYIGIKATSEPLSEIEQTTWGTYTWTKWEGEDGWGWEQIFKATSDNNPPYIEMDQQNLSESELIELGWSDKPVSVSETNKYVWYLFRKSNSKWQGETIQNDRVYAALFDHWTTDGSQGPAGVGILSIAEFYLTSPLSSGVTVETEGWKQDEPEHKLDNVNRYLWNYTQTTYTDGRIVNTDPIIIGGYGEDAISISLSNESDKMAWFPSGELQKNTMSCTVSAVRNGESLEVKHVSCKLPEGIVLQDTQRLGESLTYNLYAPEFLENGVYNCVIKFTVNGEVFERTLTIVVENLKDIDVDVIMDQTITVDSTVKTIAPHTEVEWYILGVSWWEVEEQKIYSRKQVEVTGVRAVINGAPASWSISELKIGDSVINRYSSTNPDLELYTWNEEMGYILIQFSVIPDNILTNGIVRGSITFDVEGKTVVKPVIFNCSYNDKYDFEITPNTVKKGETVSVKLSYILKNGEGQVYRNYRRVEPGSNTVYDNFAGIIDVKVNNAYITPVNNAIELTVQDDVTFEFYKHGSEELIGMQTLSCLDIQVLDYYSIETDSPFVSVTETALVGNGKTVNGPINVYIKHHVGNTVTVSNNIPENCYVQVNGIVPPVLTAGNTLDFGTSAFSYLYKDLEPIKLELYNSDKELLDSLTIEKTVVYPDPIIYPAGEFDSSKSFIMNFKQIPYVYVQTGDSIEYYVGNKSILEKYHKTEINLNGSVLATEGADPRDLVTEEDDLLWNKMDSFEAVYADIGIFKQALVGPLVFYKDYVFSQEGKVYAKTITNSSDSQTYDLDNILGSDGQIYKVGSTMLYSVIPESKVMFKHCESTGVNGMFNCTELTIECPDMNTALSEQYWIPNYWLNAKTGEIKTISGNGLQYTTYGGDSAFTVNTKEWYISPLGGGGFVPDKLIDVGTTTIGGVNHIEVENMNTNESISTFTIKSGATDSGFVNISSPSVALNITKGTVVGIRPTVVNGDFGLWLLKNGSELHYNFCILNKSYNLSLPLDKYSDGETLSVLISNNTTTLTITCERNIWYNGSENSTVTINKSGLYNIMWFNGKWYIY